MSINPRNGFAGLGAVLALWLGALAVSAADSNVLRWDTGRDRVAADVRNLELWPLLERIAAETGWHILVEPGCDHTASVKFSDLPSGQALRMLLGDLNFAFVPRTNAVARLYVFRTSADHATQFIRAFKAAAGAKRVPNELILKVKPGVNIDDLARKLGAKVIGRLEGENIYRLQFDDDARADAALAQLVRDSDIEAVDYNYYIDRPAPLTASASGAALPLDLRLNPPADTGRIIVGLVDTGVQPLCGNLNQFMLTGISVAGEAAAAGNSPTHGTAMADAVLRGMAAAARSTSVQILPVDIYGANSTATTFNVAAGIVAAVNHGANVINLSLGGQGDSALLQGLIQSVHDRGIPVFAAAGNEPVTTPFYPAAYPGVIAVTAVDQGRIAPYANRGSFVAVGAPGSDVFCFNGQNYVVQGTSPATAYASGLAAGVRDVNHLSWNQVEQIILSRLPVPK